MADNLYTLLQWMAIKTRTSPEDVVVALHGAKTNHLLEQEYIRRFTSDSYFEPFSTPVVEDEYLRYYLHDFQLDMPRLLFGDEDLDDSVGWLNMVIIDGTKVTLESITDGYKVTALDAITPLHGPVLSLNLHLDEVDGAIKDSGKITLDLSKSSDFSVDIDEDPKLQFITGALFRGLFESLPAEQRIFPLGEIKPGDAPEHLRPHVFALRTQRDTGDNGSLLIFISMKEGFTGKPPSVGNDFKFLHPIDRPQSTATLMLGIRRTLLLALYPRLLEQFGQTPTVEYDDQRLGRIKLSNVEANEPRKSEVIENYLSFQIALAINNDPGRAKQDNFTIELTETQGTLNWDAIEIEVMIDEFSKETDDDDESDMDNAWENAAKAWYGVDDASEEEHKASKREVLKMHYTTNYTVEDGPPVRIVRQPGSLLPVDFDRWSKSLYEYFYPLHYYNDASTAEQRANGSVLQCRDEVTKFAKRAVSKLDEIVAIDEKVDNILDKLLALGFDEVIVGGETYGPCDAVRFAQIAVHQDAPTLTPQWLIVGSDQTRQMQAAGSSPIKRWEVEALQGGKALGTIDPQSGVYRAPKASQFQGNLWRERIKATTESGAYSYSLTTVTKSNLLISPLVKICVAGRKEQLVASSTLVDPSVLQWSLEGEAKGELDATTGRGVGYTPPPEASGKSYVIDEIVAKDPAAPDTDTFRVYMITLMKSKPANIHVSDVVQGVSARLRPLSEIDPDKDEVTWKVILGPEGIEPVTGSANGEAIYRPVPGAADRFALIDVEIKKPGPLGTKRGMVILPLPLHEYKLPDQQ
ncbi:hypothetical protein [Pseudomonas maumuensis]|uniref:DUF4815 domain-containing protein n=1 Tax=Pseudomonas maumuensis TaxID=2842354 RepID=A0ABX8NGY2_9PSED|nr:hypothetical protein [Pseudomonas maumuensis]QXH55342.1 hypothetical protein KSS90_18660 [Pseudomonas maumuensis]